MDKELSDDLSIEELMEEMGYGPEPALEGEVFDETQEAGYGELGQG